MTAPLSAIPLIDIRDRGFVWHAIDAADRARALREDCVAWLPRGAAATLPVIDAATRRWLRRSGSAYVAEIDEIAATLRLPGIWFLNGCYQWGCTAVARDGVGGGAPWLARTLDWPFPGLGRHVEVVRSQAPAGVYDAVSWPGYIGVLTASAPGRFAAAINQAPLRRRWRRPLLRPFDMTLNALRTWRIRHIPPDHLLREVFETCSNFEEAKHKLQTAPVARPVIYTLAGCAPGEHCIIERTEEQHVTYSGEACAANDWVESRRGWEARTRADLLLTHASEQTAANSRARREHMARSVSPFTGCFDWLTPPILNSYTRLAVEMCPASAALYVMGFEPGRDIDLPTAVTQTVYHDRLIA